jgi:cysteinyl-tRNA synthetase
MHNAFLNIDNKKMSKSEGNFFTVREICEQYDPQVVRFFMLNSHYRSPLNFSKDLMESAKNSLTRILTAIGQLEFLLTGDAFASGEVTESESKLLGEAEGLHHKYKAALDDDFNTADAIAAIFELVKLANTNCSSDSTKAFIQSIYDLIVKLCEILGISTKKEEEMLAEDIEKLIEERQAARKNKDFARSDEIRNLLLEKGILLEDTREGVRWKRS